MTFLEFCCCSAIGFSTALSMFILTVSNNPIRIIILIASAFCWLLALLTSSIIWAIVPVEKILVVHIISSVLLQEFFRYVAYKILTSFEQAFRGILRSSTSLLPDIRVIAYVSGFGFGTISAAFSLVNILAEIKGPGTVGLNASSEWFSLISSIITMLFVLLHTCWGIIFFKGLSTMDWTLLFYVIFSHLLASIVTTVNLYELYYISVPALMIITGVSMIYSYKISGGKFKHFWFTLVNSFTPESGSISEID